MSETIFSDWIRVLDKHTGKRAAIITHENDGKKNIYHVTLWIRDMTPEDEKELTFYTRKNARRVAEAFLDPDRDDFYWSQSIDDFLNKYYNA